MLKISHRSSFSYETFCRALYVFGCDLASEKIRRDLYFEFSRSGSDLIEFVDDLIFDQRLSVRLLHKLTPVSKEYFNAAYHVLFDRRPTAMDFQRKNRYPLVGRALLVSKMRSSSEYLQKRKISRECRAGGVSLSEKDFFIHIPKTAGMSVAKLLGESIPGFYHETSGRFDLARFKEASVVGGHWGVRRFSGCTSDFRSFLAVVRDPLDRAISRFNYYRKKYKNDKKLQASSFNPDDFKATLNTGFADEFLDNLQCRMLCGEPNFKYCLEYMKSRKFTLGHFEYLNEFVSEISRKYKVEKVLPLENVAGEDYKSEFLRDLELIEKLNARNSEDKKLSDYIRSKTLFDSTEIM